MEKPAQRRKAEIIGADAAVEMAPGGVGDSGGAFGNLPGFFVQPIEGRHRADQDQAIIVVAKRPGEFEKA